jgi:hypothetical protein
VVVVEVEVVEIGISELNFVNSAVALLDCDARASEIEALAGVIAIVTALKLLRVIVALFEPLLG